jgi:uncharacterized protein YndB with AHSA1/START domain
VTEPVAATRSLVVEREMPHPPERTWRALTQASLIEEWLMKNDFQLVVGHRFNFRAARMEQTGFRPEDEANYQGANYGWQRYVAGLVRVAARLD